MKSYLAKPNEVELRWVLIDAEGQIVGRLAVQIANILRGRHKPQYTPHEDSGDFVVVKLRGEQAATFKQLKIYDDQVVLHPLNPDFKDTVFDRKQFDRQAKIIGRVVRKVKSYT